MKKLLLLCVISALFTATYAQTTTIKGTVNDAKGTPVAAASVHLLNTNFSTSANGKGVFVFNNVPTGNYSIEVSAIGYAAAVKVINVTGSSTEINFQLASS